MQFIQICNLFTTRSQNLAVICPSCTNLTLQSLSSIEREKSPPRESSPLIHLFLNTSLIKPALLVISFQGSYDESRKLG